MILFFLADHRIWNIYMVWQTDVARRNMLRHHMHGITCPTCSSSTLHSLTITSVYESCLCDKPIEEISRNDDNSWTVTESGGRLYNDVLT